MATTTTKINQNEILPNDFEETCESIENYLINKYPISNGALPKNKNENEFRHYNKLNKRVSNFYKENHSYQTLNFVLNQKKKYEQLNLMEMSIWEGIIYEFIIIKKLFVLLL